MYESMFWTGDNLEEIMQFCGDCNVMFNIDEQTLYVITNDGIRPVAYDNAIKKDEVGRLIVE